MAQLEEWPRVTWDQPTLAMVARAVRQINPHVVYESDDSAESCIRGMAEMELYRSGGEHGLMICTGGWQVTFIKGDRPFQYTAWPSLSPYTVLRFAAQVAA
jgi:hypothetical protein